MGLSGNESGKEKKSIMDLQNGPELLPAFYQGETSSTNHLKSVHFIIHWLSQMTLTVQRIQILEQPATH